MNKSFDILIVFLLFSSSLFSQRIEYSANHLLNSPKYQYKIIGKVKDNIIIWKTYLSNQQKAKIFIYDISMRFINSFKINILKSDGIPNPQFFATDNFFWISYQYKDKNILFNRLACFYESGNIKFIRNLDSIAADDNSLLGQTFFYKILPSAHNTLCFMKMVYDAKNYILKFNCSYVNESSIIKKNFVIPFDEKNEDLANIIVDSSNNILLLKHVVSASVVNLKLIKKNFSDDLMLITGKSLTDYQFLRNSINISQKANGYLIFGDVKKDSSNKSGFYVWQTDSLLNDYAQDTIIRNASEQISTFTTNISTNSKLANTFVVWHVLNRNDTFYTSNNYTAYNPLLQSSNLIYPGSYTQMTRADGAYIPPSYITNQSFNSSTPLQPAFESRNISSIQLIDNKIDLFRIGNDNKIIWSNTFKGDANITSANVENAIVLAGNTAIHLIYEVVTEKNLITLNQIIIKPDGSFAKNFFVTWNPTYNYNLNDCTLLNNNEFIVPATKGAKLIFAKMKIE